MLLPKSNIAGDRVFTKGTHYFEIYINWCESGSVLFGLVPDGFSNFQGGISSHSPGISWYPFFQKPDNLRIKGYDKKSYGFVAEKINNGKSNIIICCMKYGYTVFYL